MKREIVSPLVRSIDGRNWRLFVFSYETADGVFSGHLYALSMEHAAARLEELKATAKLDGELRGVIDVEGG